MALEPLGVPHRVAEEISLVTAGLLFTPEMIAMDIRITIENIKEKTKKFATQSQNQKTKKSLL